MLEREHVWCRVITSRALFLFLLLVAVWLQLCAHYTGPSFKTSIHLNGDKRKTHPIKQAAALPAAVIPRVVVCYVVLRPLGFINGRATSNSWTTYAGCPFMQANSICMGKLRDAPQHTVTIPTAHRRGSRQERMLVTIEVIIVTYQRQVCRCVQYVRVHTCIHKRNHIIHTHPIHEWMLAVETCVDPACVPFVACGATGEWWPTLPGLGFCTTLRDNLS